MSFTLYSLSVYEEIVVHNNLKMMTKLTQAPTATHYWRDSAIENDIAFRKAHAAAGRIEATLVAKQKSKLPPCKLYPPDID